jgi:uncharacterized protein (UPF0147 family)
MWYFSAKIEQFSVDTWVFRYGLENEPASRLYLIGLYFAITTLTTVGYGDFSAGTTGEYIIGILWMMFGVGFYSLLAGTLSSVLTSLDAKQAALEEKQGVMDLYAKDTDLPANVRKLAVKQLQNPSENLLLEDSTRLRLLMNLPKKLRYNIAMKMYNKAANKITFFKEVDRAFVSNVVPQLTFKKLKA